MTPEELIRDIDECYGICGKLCMSCPESRYLQEIREVVVNLMNERDDLKSRIDVMAEYDPTYSVCSD